MFFKPAVFCAAMLLACCILCCGQSPASAAEQNKADRLLVWQNYTSGDVVWWKVDGQGHIVDEDQGSGWGLVSKTHKVPRGWDLVGSYPSGEQRVLIWHNRNKGLVAYWRINADGRLLGVDDSGWGLVSSEMRVGSNWELSDISRVGEHEVLFWKNLVNGMVAFWRLNSDDTLLDSSQGSGWGYVAEGVDLSKGWVLGGVVDIDSVTTMIWRNENAGKVAFWRINAQECTMQDIQEGSGWGLVSGDLKVSASWKLRAVLAVGGHPMLLWQNSSTGSIAYWNLNNQGQLTDEIQDSGWGLVNMDLDLGDNVVFAGATVVGGKIIFFLQQPDTGAVYHVELNPENPTAFQPLDAAQSGQEQESGESYGLVAPALRMNASWALRVILDSSK